MEGERVDYTEGYLLPEIQNCQRTPFVLREGISSPSNTNALEKEGEMLFLWVLQFSKESFSGLRLVTIILHSQAQVAVETFHEFLGQRDCFKESIHFFLIRDSCHF